MTLSLSSSPTLSLTSCKTRRAGSPLHRRPPVLALLFLPQSPARRPPRLAPLSYLALRPTQPAAPFHPPHRQALSEGPAPFLSCNLNLLTSLSMPAHMRGLKPMLAPLPSQILSLSRHFNCLSHRNLEKKGETPLRLQHVRPMLLATPLTRVKSIPKVPSNPGRENLPAQLPKYLPNIYYV